MGREVKRIDLLQRVLIFTGIVAIGAVTAAKKSKSTRISLLIVYLVGFIYFTFLTREPAPRSHISLALFKELRNAVTLDVGVSEFLRGLLSGEVGNVSVEWNKLGDEVVLNILLFIPLGYLIPTVISFFRKHLWTTVLIGLLLSLSVEMLQYLTRRGWTDVDDLVNNTIGAAVGVLIYRLVLRKKIEE